MITYAEARAAKPKNGKEISLSDGNGLYLRIRVNGSKSWYLQKSINGKIQKKVIGLFPDIGISEARVTAKMLIKQLTETTSDEARKKEVTSQTFKQVYDVWFTLKQAEIKNWRDISSRFENHVIPKLGHKTFGSILPMDVLDCLQPLSKAGKLETIKRICIWLRQIEDYAYNAGIIDTERLQKISKLFRRPTTEHRPAIHPSELKSFFQNALNSPRTSINMMAILKVAMYTLLRPGEYTVMKWSWIHDGIIEVPAELMKMKRIHRVPISKQLQAVLDNIPRRNDYVFYSAGSASGHISENSLGVYLKRLGYKDKLTAHGIRSVGRTWMAENKISFDVAELCLAHSVGTQTVQAYNRTDLLDERREAMQKWCDFVETQLN
ncbi:MAG: tyrosine-type recombinase/integrase [Succinatimonas sp.]|nr:tyrosine-type recombinase/integrase [Succinatimonas sp.]